MHYSSIHPFSSVYPALGRGGSRLSTVVQMSPITNNDSQLLLAGPEGLPRPDGLYSPYQLNVPGKTSKVRHSGGICELPSDV